MAKKQIVVIGSGFSGLSAATHLADKVGNCRVIILEKNDSPGGRARKFKADGFVFDMGPSWYWMPDVFENYFSKFGKKTTDYYDLIRLDPSYRVFYSESDILDVPADYKQFREMFESIEHGSGDKLDEFLAQAKYNYEVGMNEMVNKPGLSLSEFADYNLLLNMVRLNIFQTMSDRVRSSFKDERIIRLLEFPVLFLGETAENIPSMYSLMNYADIMLGTWYPMGGMSEIIKGMVTLAEEKGVEILYSSEVISIEVEDFVARRVRLVTGETIECDFIVAAADYHHVDSQLLDACYSNYTDEYWNNRVLAPSCLLFYLGVNKRLVNLRHHNLFFDEPLGPHADAIYNSPRWPDNPLFYVSVPSITDSSVAPEGMENIFVLIPLAPGLKDTEVMREKYYNIVMDRLETITNQEIRPCVIYKRSYAHNDFTSDYHAYKGNAYGLANTLLQTAIFKPRLKNNVVSNLYYTGQMTVPGPGMPPCLISGGVVAKEIIKDHKINDK